MHEDEDLGIMPDSWIEVSSWTRRHLSLDLGDLGVGLGNKEVLSLTVWILIRFLCQILAKILSEILDAWTWQIK